MRALLDEIRRDTDDFRGVRVALRELWDAVRDPIVFVGFLVDVCVFVAVVTVGVHLGNFAWTEWLR